VNILARKVALLDTNTRRGAMKYVCLGYYEPAKHAAMTEAERHAMLDECFEYDDHLRAHGHVAAEVSLQPSESAVTLYWKNGKVATTDGPYTETKEHLGGIGVLEARDMNHAIQLVSQHPSLKYGARFEIRPAADMNEMMQESEQRRRKRTIK
jgi:hypothetical protein